MKRLLVLILLTTTVYAEGVFSIGHKNFGFTVGSSSGYGNDYTVVGANVNYFVKENLSVGIGYDGYFGDDPKIHQLTIPVTYYYTLDSQYHPYGGLLYRHVFISDPYEGYDVYGARVGLAMQINQNSYVSFGWVQEYYKDRGDGSDSKGSPEVSFGFTF